MQVPLTYRNVPKGYMVASLDGDSLSITIKGQGWSLGQITFGRSPKFLLDIKGKKGRFSLLPKNFVERNHWLASNIQIVEISPQKLDFQVFKAYEKKVKVIKNFTYKLASDYVLIDSIRIEPSVVKLMGPRKTIKGIGFVRTEAFDFKDVHDSVRAFVNLEKFEFVKEIPSKVSVVFNTDRMVDKTFFDVKVETKNIPSNQSLEIIPPRIEVILRGGLKLLAKYREKDIKAFVTFRQAIEDTMGAIVPRIIAPPFTKVLTIKPKRLKYIIKKY